MSLFSRPEPSVQFYRRHHEEQLLFYFEFGPVVQLEKVFLIWSSGRHFVQQSATICATLVAGLMRINSAKLF